MRSQTTYPVVAHVLQLDPVTIPLSWNDKTGRNHQNLHVVVDLADGTLKGVVQIENVVEHLWDNVGLVDGSVDDGGRVLAHVHEREETSVFHLLFEQLGDIDQVVCPDSAGDNTERNQNTLKLPETFREIRDLVDPLNLSRVHLLDTLAGVPYSLTLELKVKLEFTNYLAKVDVGDIIRIKRSERSFSHISVRDLHEAVFRKQDIVFLVESLLVLLDHLPYLAFVRDLDIDSHSV